MAPAASRPRVPHPAAQYPRLTYSIFSLAAHGLARLTRGSDASTAAHAFAKRAEEEPHDTKFIVFAALIPVLVLLSGLFAGLTLGYMSLDETQLHVLSISGTPKQQKYAKRIMPIRKNGHFLLITLILGNMIVNESLPIIADPVLGGGIQSVVVSTVLIVIFAEIIPQSLCTRYGLAIGAQMAWFVKFLMVVLGVVSWPVAKGMEYLLGPHHGIMYRRAELKELIAMHSAAGEFGGDLKSDTITIIGATLDLQEKVVRQAMTPLEKVFMLSIDDKLDYSTIQRIVDTGHSRVPIYEEVEVPVITKVTLGAQPTGADASGGKNPSLPDKVQKVKKLVGILLVKQCLLLDPKDATPLRSIKLNPLPCVPSNEPILKILDKFQEGRSHMAIVSRFSVDKANSVKMEVKKGLTQRLKDRVGMGDSSDSSSESSGDETGSATGGSATDRDATLRGDGAGKKKRKWRRKSWKRKDSKDSKEGKAADVEAGDAEKEKEKSPGNAVLAKALSAGREQSLPDDAVLGKAAVEEILESMDPYVMPLGIITLEDVVEEIIGEEIYDEFDSEGQSTVETPLSPTARRFLARKREHERARAAAVSDNAAIISAPIVATPQPASPAPSGTSTPTAAVRALSNTLASAGRQMSRVRGARTGSRSSKAAEAKDDAVTAAVSDTAVDAVEDDAIPRGDRNDAPDIVPIAEGGEEKKAGEAATKE